MNSLADDSGKKDVNIIVEALQALNVSYSGHESSLRCVLTEKEARACKIASGIPSLGKELWRQGESSALSFVCIRR